jgi:hypothetical protein
VKDVDKLTHINNKYCLLIIGGLLVGSVRAESVISIDYGNLSVESVKSPSKLEYEASLNNQSIEAVDLEKKLDLSRLNNIKETLTFSGLAGRSGIDLLNIETVESNLVSSGSNLALNNELSLPDLVKIGLNYSPVMQQAQASFESAEAQANIARAELLPSVVKQR